VSGPQGLAITVIGSRAPELKRRAAVASSTAVLDLHAHVLPALDDGPADMAGSISLAAAAENDGVELIAATPHLRHDFPGVRPAELADRVSELSDALGAAGVGVQVVPAGEVDVFWARDADDDTLRLVSYAQRGSDLLVETPYGSLPPVFEDALFDLVVRGYRVLLAHPERCPDFQRDPASLNALVRRGTLLQVTASALAAGRGSRSGRLARALVREGLAHVIASDAHGDAAPGRPGLRVGVEAASRLAPRRARWMATEAPAAVLAGEPLPPAPTDTRGGWRWRRRR
jgi:protein-tyrosine phosphatase